MRLTEYQPHQWAWTRLATLSPTYWTDGCLLIGADDAGAA